VHAPGQGSGEPHGTGQDHGSSVGGVGGTGYGTSGRAGGIGMMRPCGGEGVGAGVGAGITRTGGDGSDVAEAIASGDAPLSRTAS